MNAGLYDMSDVSRQTDQIGRNTRCAGGRIEQRPPARSLHAIHEVVQAGAGDRWSTMLLAQQTWIQALTASTRR